MTCLFVFTASGGERQPRSAPSLAPGSAHQHRFLKFPLSLINITACTCAALINRPQVAVLRVAAATTGSALQPALLPTRRGRPRGAVSKQQAFCSAFSLRGGNLALFCGYTSLSPQGRAQRGGRTGIWVLGDCAVVTALSAGSLSPTRTPVPLLGVTCRAWELPGGTQHCPCSQGIQQQH